MVGHNAPACIKVKYAMAHKVSQYKAIVVSSLVMVMGYNASRVMAWSSKRDNVLDKVLACWLTMLANNLSCGVLLSRHAPLAKCSKLLRVLIESNMNCFCDITKFVMGFNSLKCWYFG